MQEVFEKIIEQLKSEVKRWEDSGTEYKDKCEIAVGRGLRNAIEIVKQEAEKFDTDTNVWSNGWTSCSERLPEENSSVIACFAHGAVTELAFYDGLFHWIYDYNTNVIIAWQPLPQPYQPKGE